MQNTLKNKEFAVLCLFSAGEMICCKCRWEIKENRPSLLTKTISDNSKNIYAALEYSVIQNLGSQVYGIGVDVAKIGTKIITDIRFFSLYVRRKISIYEKFTHVDCTEDHFLLADFYNKNSWRDISRLNNKYTNLLKKVQQK